MVTPVPTFPTTDTAHGQELPSLRALLQQVEHEYNRSISGLLSENIELHRRLSCFTGEHGEQQRLGCNHDDAEMAKTDTLVFELGPAPDVAVTMTTNHSMERLFGNIDCFSKGWVNASDIENAIRRGKDDLPSDMLTRIQKMIDAVHMTMQEPEERPPEELGVQGFKFIMLVDNPNETLGDEVADTVQLVREGCLKGAAASLITRALDLNHTASTLPQVRTVWNKWLEPVIATVIVTNALCIGVSEDWYKGHDFWKVLEIIFTLCFVLELVIKLKEEGFAEHFFGPDCAWSWFDFIISMMALVDTVHIFLYFFTDFGDSGELNKFTILRLARVVRITRLVKILRFKLFKELAVMISGVIGGMRTLFWAFVLLLLLVYTLGVLMRQVTQDISVCGPSGQGCLSSELQLHKYHEELFSTVFRSMFTVFRCFTDGCSAPDGTPLQILLWDTHGWVFVCGYVLSFIFVIFGVFNIIAAVFVESVLAAAKLDERKRKMVQHGAALQLAENLRNLVHRILKGDTTLSRTEKRSAFAKLLGKSTKSQDNNRIQSKHVHTSLTKHNFERLLLNPDVQKILKDLDVSVYERGKLFDFLDADGDGELGVNEMIEGLLRVRGPVEKGDVVSSALILRSVQREIRLVDAKITEHRQLMERMRADLAYAVRELTVQI